MGQLRGAGCSSSATTAIVTRPPQHARTMPPVHRPGLRREEGRCGPVRPQRPAGRRLNVQAFSARQASPGFAPATTTNECADSITGLSYGSSPSGSSASCTDSPREPHPLRRRNDRVGTPRPADRCLTPRLLGLAMRRCGRCTRDRSRTASPACPQAGLARVGGHRRRHAYAHRRRHDGDDTAAGSVRSGGHLWAICCRSVA